VPVLDTDVLTIVQRRTEPEFSRFRARILSDPTLILKTSIISFEGQIRGWLAVIKNAKRDQLIAAYSRLHALNEDFSRRVVLPFDGRALNIYEELLAARTGLGQMDLRIAAIAIANNDVLISRNLRHFRKVAELRVEDWTE
jgi:tRNA(fMet)-specific endonuclease VapC